MVKRTLIIVIKYQSYFYKLTFCVSVAIIVMLVLGQFETRIIASGRPASPAGVMSPSHAPGSWHLPGTPIVWRLHAQSQPQHSTVCTLFVYSSVLGRTRVSDIFGLTIDKACQKNNLLFDILPSVGQYFCLFNEICFGISIALY